MSIDVVMSIDVWGFNGFSNYKQGPGHTGQMEGLRMDRGQIPTFA